MIDDAMARFTRHQRPQDRVLLAAFASQMRVIQDWGSTREVQFYRDPRLCRATRYYAALNWAEDALRSIKTRRGIVILTDGVDSAPDATETQDFSRALNRFRGAGIPLYFVAVGTDLNPTPGVPGHAPEVRLRMERLAEVSGGNVVFPETPEEVIPLYEQIARELGTSYSLGYAPPNTTPAGKRHRIEVRLRAGKLQVRQSRTEYIWK